MGDRICHSLVALTLVVLLLFAASGCIAAGNNEQPPNGSLSPVALGAGEKLRVVATTSIVGDVVQNIGGDRIELTVLMPPGTDPHAFEPTPQDAAAVADGHVLFANGAGLETFLEPLLASAGEQTPLVSLSASIDLLHLEGEQGEADPHVWFDPHNVILWTHSIEQALSALDPANGATYRANGEAYRAELEALDAWIEEQVAQIDTVDRKLVTDHAAFNYFAHRYGFEQVGAVFPGFSTLAAPSAQELSELEEAIRASGVRAVFVGVTVNPQLAQQVAEDTGIMVVPLYTGSLSGPEGPANSYLALMRTDVSAIVAALR